MDKRVSVAMAVYNSEKYISEQIDSILIQLSKDDELVISYNKSTDNTWDIINEYKNKDNRVKVVNCETKGVQPNFNNAILNTKGKYIFLSDHDDVWLNKKIEKMLDEFNDEKTMVVMHSRIVTDEKLTPIKRIDFRNGTYSGKFINNFISNKFCGSTMAFRHELIPIVCPLPLTTNYHDVWIGLMGALFGKVELLNEPLILYRRHGLNESSDTHRKVSIILKDRITLIYNITKRLFELKIRKKTK